MIQHSKILTQINNKHHNQYNPFARKYFEEVSRRKNKTENNVYTNIVKKYHITRPDYVEQIKRLNSNNNTIRDNEILNSNSNSNENENENTNVKNTSPIDLEETFDNSEPLETNIQNNNKKQNLFDLEEADIDFSNLQDVNELTPQTEEVEVEVEDPSILKEIDLSSTLDNSLETLQLKKPNQVFYEIYQKARERAKEAKKNAILAYLEMKNIKKTYMLDDIDESDNEFDEFASRDSSSEISDTESLENE
jgi:hypothetical protein